MSFNVIEVPFVADTPICLLQFTNIELINKIDPNVVKSLTLSLSLKNVNTNTKVNTISSVSLESVTSTEIDQPTVSIKSIVAGVSLHMLSKMHEEVKGRQVNCVLVSVYNEVIDPFLNDPILEMMITKSECKLSKLFSDWS